MLSQKSICPCTNAPSDTATPIVERITSKDPSVTKRSSTVRTSIDVNQCHSDVLFRRHHSSTAALCDIFIFINIDEQKSRVDTCMYLASLERTSSLSRLLIHVGLHVMLWHMYTYWCYQFVRYATKYQVTYEIVRVPYRQAGLYV